MPQFFGRENLTKLQRISNTVVRLPSGSTVKLAGQGYTLGDLDCTTSVSGFGGIDTGSVAALSFYYVYLVRNLTSVGLVASLSASAPTGFSSSKKVGAFYTDGSSNVFKAYWFGEINQTVFSAQVSAAGVVSGENINWINGNFSVPSSTFTGNFISGLVALPLNCVVSNANPAVSDFGVRSVVSTSSSLSYTTVRTDNGAASAQPSSIVAQKQGVDAIQPDWSI